MAWELEIHHIDVEQGDSTLIIAKNVVGKKIVTQRAMLIDGGLREEASYVSNYLAAIGIKVDVMVATHYDEDHVNGLTYLLKQPNVISSHVNIFDQGWPPTLDETYVNYHLAINGCDQLGIIENLTTKYRSRVTNCVNSTFEKLRLTSGNQFFNRPPATCSTVTKLSSTRTSVKSNTIMPDKPADWLVGKEIFWTDFKGIANPDLYGTSPAPGEPNGPPKITCIAANAYYLSKKGKKIRPESLIAVDPRNAKSLTLLLEFNGFRYFIGGDLEGTQEDALIPYLEHNKKLPIHGLKLSHHGSQYSSSNTFLEALKPVVAFVSCGWQNNYKHPHKSILTVLGELQNVIAVYMTQDGDTYYHFTKINKKEVGSYESRMLHYKKKYKCLPRTPGSGYYTGGKTIVAGSWKAKEGDVANIERNVKGNILLRASEETLLTVDEQFFTVTYHYDNNEYERYFQDPRENDEVMQDILSRTNEHKL